MKEKFIRFFRLNEEGHRRDFVRMIVAFTIFIVSFSINLSAGGVIVQTMGVFAAICGACFALQALCALHCVLFKLDHSLRCGHCILVYSILCVSCEFMWWISIVV